MCDPLSLIPSTKERKEIKEEEESREEERREEEGEVVLKSDHMVWWNTYLACMRYQGPSPSTVGMGQGETNGWSDPIRESIKINFRPGIAAHACNSKVGEPKVQGHPCLHSKCEN